MFLFFADQQDYGSTVVVISFAPSEFQKTVAVPIISDAILEAAQESFIGRLTLTNPAQVGVAVTQGMVTVDIIDDDSKALCTNLSLYYVCTPYYVCIENVLEDG